MRLCKTSSRPRQETSQIVQNLFHVWHCFPCLFFYFADVFQKVFMFVCHIAISVCRAIVSHWSLICPLQRQINSLLNINLYINISTGPLISSLHFFLHTKRTLILFRDSTDDSYFGSVFSTVMTFNTTKYDILNNKQCSIFSGIEFCFWRLPLLSTELTNTM